MKQYEVRIDEYKGWLMNTKMNCCKLRY